MSGSQHEKGMPSLAADAWRARRGGAAALLSRQRRRLVELVAFARARSPYFAERLSGLPDVVSDPVVLPVTSKPELMSRFDEWVTDPEVTRNQVEELVADPSRIGEALHGRYTVATTSGTTGVRGIFVMDPGSLAVAAALSTRMLAAWLEPHDVWRILRRGGRMAMVMASSGHYASTVAAARLQRGSPARARSIRVLSVHLPVPELVAELNRFRPAIIAPYASIASILASEQEAGRLRIDPVLLTLAAEGLPDAEYGRIARAFGAKVGSSYAATECPFLSYRCSRGWMHVNSDWTLVEPVDAEHRPVPAGSESHTVLVTNLANRVQPIIRYDLGDRVLMRPDPCECGNPLPALRVQGRSGEAVRFAAGGGPVTIAPLAFSTALGSVGGIERFQVVQTGASGLRLRLLVSQTAEPEEVWRRAVAAVQALLAGHGVRDAIVERAGEAPERTAGGKYREVIPFAQ